MARRTSRRRRRRGRYGFLYKLASVLLVCAAVVAALTLFFKVNTIVVTGQSRYTREQILAAAQVETGDNMYLLNKNAVAQRIRSQCPYVEEVLINRKLPDTLLVEVWETAAAGAFVQEGDAWLVSARGKILEKRSASALGDCPVVDGCDLLAPAVGSTISFGEEFAYQRQKLLDLWAALEEAGVLEKAGAVYLGDPSVLTMEYDGRFTVRLGWEADFTYKIQNLETVIGRLEVNETGTIDLTMDGVASFDPQR